MNKFIYLLGGPGSGKSTTLRWVRLHLEVMTLRYTTPFEFLKWVKKDGELTAVELGGRHTYFPGTDRLSMSVIEKAIPFVEYLGMAVDAPVIAEGDRLANTRFFRAIRAAGYDLRLFYLDCPEAVAEERRAERTRKAGSDGELQNPAWVQSRNTKALELAREWRAQVLDAEVPAADVALSIVREFA